MAKGGLTKGKSHAKGGIKMTVKDTGQQIEVEGGEGIINKYVMTSDKKISYKGKKVTPCEIASDLNQETGNGVSFDCAETKNTDMTPTDASTGFGRGGTPNGGSVEFEAFVTPEYPYAKGGTTTPPKNLTLPIFIPKNVNKLSDFNQAVPISGAKSIGRYKIIRELFESTNGGDPILGKSWYENRWTTRGGAGSTVGDFHLNAYISQIKKNKFRVIVFVVNFKNQIVQLIKEKKYLFYRDFNSLKNAKLFASAYLWIIRGTYNDEDATTPFENWYENNRSQWNNSAEYVEVLTKDTYPLNDPPDVFKKLLYLINEVRDKEDDAESEKLDKTKELNKEKVEGSPIAMEVLRFSYNLFNPKFTKSIRQTTSLGFTDEKNFETVLQEIGERGKIDKLQVKAQESIKKNFPLTEVDEWIERYEQYPVFSGDSRESILISIKEQATLLKKIKSVKKDVAVTLAPILKVTGKAVDYLEELIEGTPLQVNMVEAIEISETMQRYQRLVTLL